MSTENPIGIESLSGHLKRLCGGSEEKARQEIERHLKNNPDLTAAQLFNTIAEEKGAGKTHLSAHLPRKEGKLKKVRRSLGQSRRRNRRR